MILSYINMTCLNAFPIRNNNNNNLLRINYNNTNDNNNNNNSNNNNNNTTITTNIIIKRKKKPRYDKYRYWFQSWTNGASVDKTNVSLSESERTPTQTACMHHKLCNQCISDPDCGYCREYNGDTTPQFTDTCMPSNEQGVINGPGEDGPDCKEINKNFFYNNCKGFVNEN